VYEALSCSHLPNVLKKNGLLCFPFLILANKHTKSVFTSDFVFFLTLLEINLSVFQVSEPSVSARSVDPSALVFSLAGCMSPL
jgi:hypothetical protein